MEEITLMSNKSRSSSVSVTSLAASLEPLREYFNEHKDELRFVALVSPT